MYHIFVGRHVKSDATPKSVGTFEYKCSALSRVFDMSLDSIKRFPFLRILILILILIAVILIIDFFID